MKNKKFLKITKEEMSRFPIKFNFIDYWKFDDSKDRIDNFNDPYFDGVEIKKYQCKNYMPMGSIKPISKIINYDLLITDEK